jgi:acyl-CoA synthetase (AMP-forming)/AMP-acid ligase II
MLGRRAAFIVIAMAAAMLAGCSSTPIPPTYTQDELKAICERHGGWWHPDELVGGYCEYESDSLP